MSVLVYTESENGKFKKAALEVVSYAKAVADQMGTTVTAVVPSVFHVPFPSGLSIRWRSFLLMRICQRLAHTEGVLAAGLHTLTSESWSFLWSVCGEARMVRII